MKYIVTNIKYQYDTDTDTDGEEIDLPETLEINVPDDITDEDEISEYISDEISNITGYCHLGFSDKIVEL